MITSIHVYISSVYICIYCLAMEVEAVYTYASCISKKAQQSSVKGRKMIPLIPKLTMEMTNQLSMEI